MAGTLPDDWSLPRPCFILTTQALSLQRPCLVAFAKLSMLIPERPLSALDSITRQSSISTFHRDT